MTEDIQPAETGDEPPRRDGARFGWWHDLRPLTRRAIRVGSAVVLALLISMGFAVATASYTGSLGPHVAEYSTRLNGEVRVDMGPLGSLVIDSPMPANLGANVLVHEIPDQLTAADEDPISGLMADLNSYEQFLANPQATIDDAVRGLVEDAIGRAVVTLSVLLLAIALSRLAAHGVLREAVKSAWRQPGVPFVAPVLVAALVILPMSDLTRSFGLEGRTSPVLAGTPLADARITGRLATIVDHYGGMVVSAVEDNERFYAEVNANLVEAYAADPAPLAPPARPAPAEEDADDEEEVDGEDDADGPEDAAGAGAQDADTDGEPEAGDVRGGPGMDQDQGAGDEQDQRLDQVTEEEEAPLDALAQEEDKAPEHDPQGPSPGDDDVTEQEHTTGPLAFADPDAEYATFLMVADLHCNVGMAPVIATAAELGQVDAILNAGDTVMSGTSVESFCVNAFADALPPASDLPVVVADGNHDSVLTGEQERARGWTVLEGDVVEVAGVRILGDADPTLTEIGTGTRLERDETVVQMGERLQEQACQLHDEGDPADILLVHSPHGARHSLEAGCVPVSLSGHMHTQGGPWQLGWGVQYIAGSTAGATLGRPTVGPLQGQAAMTVIRWDVTAGQPAHYRLIHAETDASVEVGPWLNFPDMPDEFADPTSPEAPEEEPDEDVEEGDPSAPDQNLPEDEEVIREEGTGDGGADDAGVAEDEGEDSDEGAE